ncbi:MAG TPA: sigma-70 family RNA polymerase sigma factor [Elusimicrobiota bacterium]|nr:sigma-70 family RNA polymerase sigma factor [Elusimicrobiota bacterium]
MNRTRQLEKFIEDYSERGYRFAYQLCRDDEEAKELVQESFFRVIRNWDKFDPAASTESWFLTILRNLYFDALKRYERKNCSSLDALVRENEGSALAFTEVIADAREEAPFDRLEREELGAKTRAVLDALIPEHKAVLTLCDMEGLRYEDIAVVLDCPLGTVRSRICRAREAFKKKFLEMCREVVES